MSKLFSISMATVLMLMSLVGPMEPASVGDDAPQDVNPMAEELPLDDASDGEEIVIEEDEAVEPLPVEEEEVATEDEALTPVEEPAENANAPPAGDEPIIEDEPVVQEPTVEEEPVDQNDPTTGNEPVVEEDVTENEQPSGENPNIDDTENTPEASDDMLIVPNAVDPEPGECPIDEACDGGGGGDMPETVTVSITITQSTQLSDGATVVVKASGNAPVGSKVTGTTGVVEFELNVGETYLVDVTRVGYQSKTSVSLPVSSDTSAFSINLLPVFGYVNVTVTDAVTGEPVIYAIVRFTGKVALGTNFNANTNSGSTGQISTRMNSGEYVAFFSHPNYVSQQFDVTVTVGDSISVQLVPEAQEPVQNVLSLEVVDKVTGEPISNAEVILHLPTAPYTTVSEGTTDSNGRWDSSPLENIDYDLVILAPFHRTYRETVSSIPTSVWTIELESGTEVTATYTVLDVETDEPIENALVSAKDYNSGTQVAAGQTDATGNWTSNLIRGKGYWVTFEKDGYQTSTTYVYVSGDYSETVQLMPPGYPGSIKFHIYDANVGLEIPGATITMSNGEVTETILTDDEGKASLASIPSGTYDLTIEANGYETYVETIDVVPNITLHGTFHVDPLPAASLVVQLQAPVAGGPIVLTNVGATSTVGMSGPTVYQLTGTVQPIAGQTIQLVNPDTGLVMVDGVTDADGIVTLPVARQGTYQLNVTVDGYQPYSAPYELTGDSEHAIMLQPIVTDNPGDPDPGDGDDDTPINPEPGQGDDDTPTNPEPGEGDDDTPANPAPGNGNDNTTPDTGAPSDDAGTGTGNPVEGSIPDEGDVTESPAATDDGEVAQSAGSSSDASTGSVNALPNTGTGESASHVGIAAITLVAAFTLLGALGVRRRV